MKKTIQNSSRVFRKGLVFIIFIYFLSWVLKGLFISIYVVPTSSMHPAIQRDDYIMALKFPYRFKTPEFYPLSAVPFPFYSASGFIQPNRGDIWVFSSPINYEWHPSKRMTMIKRLAGLPGDTLYTVNNKIVNPMDSIAVSAKKRVVPKKGLTITLDSGNISYWEKLIQRDGSEIKVDTNCQSVIINGERTFIYKFENDFYFMMGDNELNTKDSRHWGAVPDKLLIGKAKNIIWRKNIGLYFQKL